MKKSKIPSAVILCSAFFAFFFIFQFNSLSNFYASNQARTSQVSTKGHLELKQISEEGALPLPPQQLSPSPVKIRCDRSHQNYDICSINGPTVLDPAAATFFLRDPPMSAPPVHVEKIRPYPRKWENFTMSRIREITLVSGPLGPLCQVQHNAPALVFSAGGYTGNFFHDFNDGFIPLFITVNSIYQDQDFVLVISKARDWWASKYAELLSSFSKHPIVNLDNDTSSHCFPSATLGLISHGFMTIDPTLIPNSKTFTHFHEFLDKAYDYGPKTQAHSSTIIPSRPRPRLVLVGRTGSIGRVILNQAQVVNLARRVGFDVFVFEPSAKTPLNQAYALVNSSHAMVGVHGAALTHSLFLRPGAVFVQVVPLGADWVSEACFGKSARAMGLEYMIYDIRAEESSLVDKYDRNEMLIKDPVAFRGENWSTSIMDIYLKEQNVRLDLGRFKAYLKVVYKKAREFMKKEG